VSIYVPNIGEMEALQDILNSQALRLGLYKAQVTPDGNTIFGTMTELDAESGGYQTKDLANAVVLDVLTASKWYLAINSSNKAEATYDAVDTPQEWVFNAADVDNGDTAFGVFMWTLILNFTSGGTVEFKVGDHVYGSTGNGDAIITDIRLRSGTWAAGTAAGTLCIKSQSGTFEAEHINNVGASDVSDNGDIVGDSDKQIILVESFATAQVIDTVGQKIQYTPKITLSTA